jgi:hypothetical protein
MELKIGIPGRLNPTVQERTRPISDDEHDYKVGPGRPPLHTRFRQGQSGNPGGRSKKNLPALLVDALNAPVFVTIDGERRQITKREAVVH